MTDHYEVFVQATGRTLFRTNSETVAVILSHSDCHSSPLDYVAVDASGRDIPGAAAGAAR